MKCRIAYHLRMLEFIFLEGKVFCTIRKVAEKLVAREFGINIHTNMSYKIHCIVALPGAFLPLSKYRYRAAYGTAFD